MRHWRMLPGAALLVAVLVVATACVGTTATNGTSVTPQSTPGSVTPTGPVQLGSWTMTVHSARAYQHEWQAPAGMPGNWGHMGAGNMAVVLDVSAQNRATPPPGGNTTYSGPACALRGGYGMMGPMMGNGAYGWQMMTPGTYRGPMAFMAPTSTHQFTLQCTDQASGRQASWDIGF